MEYIQTILFQISPENLDRATEGGGLISELDEHREYLKGLPGYLDMRVTRSINPEGNILVVVETRWDNDADLVRYETNEPNVASIVRKHESVIVADSLQVLDMEALRTESSWAPLEREKSARERVIMPILVPVGVLAFIVLVIYGLSRVYLEIGGDAAVGLAAGISFGVLLAAFYFASNPRAPVWQMGGVLVVAGIVLLGGSIWAVAEEDEAEGDHGPNGETPAPNGDEMVIDMGDFFFEYQGEQNPNINIPAGEELTFTAVNIGNAPHNVHINGTDDTYEENICAVGGPARGCTDPNLINGGEEGILQFAIEEPGVYNFRCDYHPQQMVGTFTVE